MLKFVPLAVIGLIGLFYIEGGNYTPFTPAAGGFDWHINAAATLALWAFIGLESATVPAEEVKDPEKTIPRATILGTLATTLLYLVALVAIVGILSQAALAGSSAPFADAANAIWGGTFLGLSWGKWIALVAMAATLGALNGWIMLTARVSLAAADDGLFPKRFARVHGERRTPVLGLLVSSVLVSALVLYNWNASFADRFTDVVLLATWMTLIAYAYAAAAEVVLFFRERELFTWAKLARDSVIAGARVRLLGLGDLGLRRGVAGQGLHAAALRDPGLRLDEVAPARPEPLPPSYDVDCGAPGDAPGRAGGRPARRRRAARTGRHRLNDEPTAPGFGRDPSERRSRCSKVIIMGAGGRDFHNFNVAFRDDPDTEVVAFTATQIPGIADRVYPASLAGAALPDRDPDPARGGADAS